MYIHRPIDALLIVGHLSLLSVHVIIDIDNNLSGMPLLFVSLLRAVHCILSILSYAVIVPLYIYAYVCAFTKSVR